MGKKVARRAPRRKPLPLSRSRRRRQEQAVQGRIHTAVAQAVQQVVEAALEEELVERLGLHPERLNAYRDYSNGTVGPT